MAGYFPDLTIPVFNRRDYTFIADLMADVMYTFDLDSDDRQALLGLCHERLTKTNNRYKREVFEDRVTETYIRMVNAND